MTVVVGFIPTPVGMAALDAAAAEAELRGGPLVVVNVVHDGDDADPRHARPDQLEMAHDRLRHRSVRIDIRQVRADRDVAEVLVRTAVQEEAELLVIGIRREREVAGHLLGAVSQKLLLDSPCDVLVV